MLKKRKPYGAHKNSVAVHKNIVCPVSISCVIIQAVLCREVDCWFCFCWKDVTQQQRTESPTVTHLACEHSGLLILCRCFFSFVLFRIVCFILFLLKCTLVM